MDDALLTKVKNTLLVILKTRQEVKAVAILAAAVEWQLEPERDYYGDDELWVATVALPAPFYALLPREERDVAERVISETIKEITPSTGHHVTSVRLAPQLVELSLTQEELLSWVKETPQLVEGELVEDEPDFGPDDDDIPF